MLWSATLIDLESVMVTIVSTGSIQYDGCYIVTPTTITAATVSDTRNAVVRDVETSGSPSFYALIDGNKVPNDMPCPAEAVIKGDGEEFMIAATSILAKVARDQLMHAYDNKEYPEYNSKQHK